MPAFTLPRKENTKREGTEQKTTTMHQGRTKTTTAMFDNIFKFDILSCGEMELFQLQLVAKVKIPHITLKNWSLKCSEVWSQP